MTSASSGARGCSRSGGSSGMGPGGDGPAVRAVAAGGTPDRREGLLHGVLGAAAVAQQAQSQAEDWAGEAAVEGLEGTGVSIGDALEEVSVAHPVVPRTRADGLRARGRGGGCLHLLIVSTHSKAVRICKGILPTLFGFGK